MSHFLSWVHGLFSGAGDIVKEALAWVEHAMALMWRALVHVFSLVNDAWKHMVIAAQIVADLIYGVAHKLYVLAHWVVHTALPAVYRWIAHEAARLESLARSLVSHLREWAADLIRDLWSFVNGIVPWVLDHVYKPLHDLATRALHWIEHEGYYAYNLLTHPDRLALLLLAPLWQAFLFVLRGSEQRIATWLLAGVYSAMVVTADIAEDILAKLV